MAIGIASDPRYAKGNMTGAVNAIEKLSKGLSKHKQVAAVLKRQNEALDLDSSLSEHLKEHGIVKEYGDKEMLMGMNMNYVLINMQNKVQGYASDKKDALDIAKRTKSTMHPIKKKITDKTLEKMNALAMTPKQLADLGIIDEADEPDLGRPVEAITEAQFDEAAGEKDACYHKVKSRYKVWPSAYASGALTKCRKVGAANWGKSKSK